MNPAPERVVRCSIADETYCIDNQWLDSIHVVDNLYPRKGQDGSIGWIRRFDEKVPVYRLADQIRRHEPSGRPHGVILVIEKNQRAWALLVDKVTAAAEVARERVFPMPSVMGPAAHKRFPWVILDRGELMLSLAPDHVVPAEVSGAATTEPHTLAGRSLALPAPAAGRPSAPSARTRQARRQIITFSLAFTERTPYEIRFAVSAGQSLEIVGDLPMVQVPGAPFFAPTLASWRALPVPVVDLGSWLGMSAAPHRPGSRLLICRAAGGPGESSLIAIPGVEDFRKLDLPIACEPWSQPITWNASLALGVFAAEQGMLVVPDLDVIAGLHSHSTSSLAAPPLASVGVA